MLPIYGSAALLFEPAHDAVRERPWWQRGAAYTAGFFAVEAASGELTRRGLCRPAYAPLWFAVGLGAERLHDHMVTPPASLPTPHPG